LIRPLPPGSSTLVARGASYSRTWLALESGVGLGPGLKVYVSGLDCELPFLSGQQGFFGFEKPQTSTSYLKV
jgi:hypothetical protein